MASIQAQKTKTGTYYYLFEWIEGKVVPTYLGTKCPLAKSRGWKGLSPEVVAWLKSRSQQKTRAIKTLSGQNGKYRTIIVDPPWPVERMTGDKFYQRPANEMEFDYPTMTISQIKYNRKLLPVRKLTNKTGCLVFLWTTQKHLPASFSILEAWGFKYLFTMDWDKGHGMKPVNLPIFNNEFVLVGKRGTVQFTSTKDFRTLFKGERRKHSQKPPEFYDLLNRVTPGPRIDMFSREKHEGFDQFGNETSKY